MKNRLLLFVICIACSSALGQVFVQPEISYGTFAMTDLKDFQLDLIKTSNIPLLPVTTFPSYVGFGLKAGVKVSSDISYGIMLHYNSTGSRAYYEDYSGLARIDMLPQAYSAGLYFKNKLNKSETWQVFSSLSILWVHTKTSVASEIRVGSQSKSDNQNFYSNNYAIRPNFILCRPITKTIYLEASAGYEFQFEGKLYLSGSSEAYLINSRGNEVKANWNGLRVSLGIGIFLKKKSKLEE